MSKIKVNFLIAILFGLPLFSLADDYPVNKNIDVKHYSFELNLSDSSDVIVGKAQIEILFKKAGVKKFRLDFINASIEKLGKGMVVDAIMMGKNTVIYAHQNNELVINLLTLSKLNETIGFTITYHGIPFDGLRIGSTKFGDRSFFSDNWPNKARNWLPLLDHPSDKATTEFVIKAPQHYKVISNGLLLEESAIGNNIRLTHWKQSVPVAPWLFVLGVADFAVKYVDQFNGKSIQTWVLPQNREQGFYDFEEPTKKVLTFFSAYVGPFAYEKLANVQSASVSGGMEASSAIFYSENLVDGKRDNRTRNVVIHELAHQWFGNAVTETTWDDVWLSEGFATYFTSLFIEDEYGKKEFEEEMIKARKSVYNLAIKFPNFSIIAPRSPEKEEVTNGITYQKGAWVLHMLRNLMGEKQFQKGLQNYYTKFFNANATTDDFRLVMEKASGKNLKPFFLQWLHQSSNPEIEGVWEYNVVTKKITIQLTQTQLGDFTFNVPIEIGYYSKGSTVPTILKFNLSKKQQTQSFVIKGLPEKVDFDPRNILLSKNNISKKEVVL